MLRIFCIFVLLQGLVFAFSIEDLKQHIKTTDIMGSFQQEKYLQNFELPIKSEGDFWVSNKELFWVVKKPIFSVIKINAEGIWQCQDCVLEDSREALFKNFLDKNFSLLPTQYDKGLFLQIMELDFMALQKNFDIMLNGNRDQWQLILNPKGLLRQIFQKITISGSQSVENITLIESNGDTTQTFFKS